MKDEIKEILQELKEKNETYKECSKNRIIENEYYKSHILLDYITNLQEENIKLKELCDKYEEEHNNAFKLWTMKMEEEIGERDEEISKYWGVLNKIKEYITTIDTDYAIGCWNKDEEFVDVKKDILKLLEEIE